MDCAHCSKPLPQRALAAISILVAGDEYIYSYFQCSACGGYSVEGFHDAFMGDSEAWRLPPITPEVGERCVALARACPDPGNKHCRCASHQALYHGIPR